MRPAPRSFAFALGALASFPLPALAQPTIRESLFNTTSEIALGIAVYRGVAQTIDRDVKQARAAYWSEHAAGKVAEETRAAYAKALRDKDEWHLHRVFLMDRDMRVMGPGQASPTLAFSRLIGGEVDGGVQPFALDAFWEYATFACDFAARVSAKPERAEQLMPELNRLRAAYERERDLAEHLFENPASPLRSNDPGRFAVGLALAGRGAPTEAEAKKLLEFLASACGQDALDATLGEIRETLVITRSVRRKADGPQNKDLYWATAVEGPLALRSARLYTLAHLRQIGEIDWFAADAIVREWAARLGAERVDSTLDRLWRETTERAASTGAFPAYPHEELARSLNVDLQGLGPGIIALRREWTEFSGTLSAQNSASAMLRIASALGASGADDPRLERLRAALGDDLLLVSLLSAEKEAASGVRAPVPVLLWANVERHAIAQRRADPFIVCAMLAHSPDADGSVPCDLDAWNRAIAEHAGIAATWGKEATTASAEKVRALMAAGPDHRSYLGNALASPYDAFMHALKGGDVSEFIAESARKRFEEDKARSRAYRVTLVENARVQLRSALSGSYGELKARPDAIDRIVEAWDRYEAGNDPADATSAAAMRDELLGQLDSAVRALEARGWHRVGTAASSVDLSRKVIRDTLRFVVAPATAAPPPVEQPAAAPERQPDDPQPPAERRRTRRGEKSPRR